MTFVTKVVEEHRADTLEEAENIIAEAKTNQLFSLEKRVITHRTSKDDDYYIVALTKVITDPKNPDINVKLTYAIPELESVF